LLEKWGCHAGKMYCRVESLIFLMIVIWLIYIYITLAVGIWVKTINLQEVAMANNYIHEEAALRGICMLCSDSILAPGKL